MVVHIKLSPRAEEFFMKAAEIRDLPVDTLVEEFVEVHCPEVVFPEEPS